MEVKLIVLRGRAKDREIPLPTSQFIIGRASRCHLRPHSELVSKVHCAIGRMAGNRVVVCDLKSRNKTFVNGKAIAGSVRVSDGDVLTVGPLEFRFSIDLQAPNECHRDQLLWLMDESTDSFDVESSGDTAIIEIPKDLLRENAAEEGSHGLSAGHLLRDQIRKAVPPASHPMIRVSAFHAAFLDALISHLSKDARMSTPTTREDVVATLVDAAMNLDLAKIHSLLDLKAALTGKPKTS
jgi:predicted component of type VI protein secretion system